MDKLIIETKEASTLNKPYGWIEKYLLNFDVLNKSGEEARELTAWLQMELAEELFPL